VAQLGAPPIPYLWAACGSQGRREQTGISDQDNCLILSDDYREAEHGAYFAALAKFVSDGLNAAGYFYCPGDMMATNPRWRQPVATWRSYFAKWINIPDIKSFDYNAQIINLDISMSCSKSINLISSFFDLSF
jgi:CBS domain-containing protein